MKRNAPAPNPLQIPLQNLLKHAEVIMSIPGFDSDSLKKGVAGAKQALGTKTKTKSTK